MWKKEYIFLIVTDQVNKNEIRIKFQDGKLKKIRLNHICNDFYKCPRTDSKLSINLGRIIFFNYSTGNKEIGKFSGQE